MKEITIGKFKFQKVWVFPSDVSKFCIQMTSRFNKSYWDDDEQCWKKHPICHVCCGKSKIGEIRIDIDPNNNPTIVGDAFKLTELIGRDSQNIILTDPPWQINWRDRQLLSYQFRDALKIGGTLIQNSPWSPWCVGMEILAIWKVSPHFNNYSDLRDFWILRKVNKGNEENRIES